MFISLGQLIMLVIFAVCGFSYLMRIIIQLEKDVKSLDEICDEYRKELYKK
ncbi:Uncharacterised protein [Klebsiella pneumoniae]|mgnify:CR=1 FL=1|jgi:hypothetical protein|nr:Uncharacterised protein [Klebsiella pneumoniae]SWB74170.1 Uncharacterised protein [Klebsiella pneumoniae]SWT27763.1 Uncharacterised protein [Klebsiella pneumoniae]SWY17034.1 Uncharacterised protein [Klebsiella pneumoniae]SXC26387.1 Uncharacterised protein [Klebsiella pneumoniae]